MASEFINDACVRKPNKNSRHQAEWSCLVGKYILVPGNGNTLTPQGEGMEAPHWESSQTLPMCLFILVVLIYVL